MHMLPDNELLWLPRKKYGFYPAKTEGTYTQDYYDKYCGLAHTEIGDALREIRLQLVKRHISDDQELLDFGIGSGDFIRSRGSNTYGYDINPAAIDWLFGERLYRNPWLLSDLPNVSFWDSLEHVEHPQPLLKRISGYVFMTVPIFNNAEHVLRSKHFRPCEHYWYWTEDGLIEWFREQGFQLIEINRAEVSAGREDVAAYVYKRNHDLGYSWGSPLTESGRPAPSPGGYRLPWS